MTITQQQAVKICPVNDAACGELPPSVRCAECKQSTAQPQAVAPARFDFKEGEWRHKEGWGLGPVQIVGVNYALNAVAIRLGPQGGIQVVPNAGFLNPVEAPKTERAPVVQATSDTARRLAAEFRGTVARKDFEAWGEEVLPLLDGMAAAPVVQAVPDSVKFICVDCTGCEKCRASSGATPADVRMLTGDEHEELENALGLAVYLSVARVIQQKFCEVNAGKRIPADGVIGGV